MYFAKADIDAEIILKLILEGTLPIYQDNSEKVKFDRLMFSVDETRNCINEILVEKDWISAEEVKQILHIGRKMFAALTKIGLLAIMEVHVNVQYLSRKSVLEFQGRYIDSKQVCQILGVSRTTIHML